MHDPPEITPRCAGLTPATICREITHQDCSGIFSHPPVGDMEDNGSISLFDAGNPLSRPPRDAPSLIDTTLTGRNTHHRRRDPSPMDRP
jgi:hypothetical protein